MTSLETHLATQAKQSRDFFWHRLRWRAVRRYVPPDRRMDLVDVGAGAGLLGEYLRAERPSVRYLFVEPIVSLERELERRFGVDSNARSVETYSAHVVTLLDVLEHQEDDVGFLRKLAERAGVGCTIIITVPALPALWSPWDESLGHFTRYTKRSLRETAESASLHTRELSYLFPEMIPGAVARKFRRGDGLDDATFPDLPRLINGSLTGIGVVTQAARRVVPFGTSLFAVFERA